MKAKVYILLLSILSLFLFISFATAETWKYNYLDDGGDGTNYYNITNYYNVTNGTNDNATYLQGYTPLTLRDYYETYFDTLYAPIGSGGDNASWNQGLADSLYCKLTGCTMTGDIDMGGNNITNAGTITADYFVGDGSGLTGVASESTNFVTYINGSAYVNVTYDLTAGDVVNLERTIEPGKQFIFGDTMT